MWLRAIIEELSSIFACVFGSVKTCIFHFLSCWMVNSMGTMADCVSCNLGLAAALCFRNNLGFCPSGHRSVFLSEGQHFLVLKDVSGLWSSTFTALTFPLPLNLSHWLAQERQRKTSVSHCKLQGGCFLPFCSLVWIEKPKLDSHWQIQVDLNYCGLIGC